MVGNGCYGSVNTQSFATERRVFQRGLSKKAGVCGRAAFVFFLSWRARNGINANADAVLGWLLG